MRPSKKKSRRTDERTRAFVVEAARLLANNEACNYVAAKLKAADRLGLKEDFAFPSHAEIEGQLYSELQTFHFSALQKNLVNQINSVIQVMESLAQFRPRLMGPLSRKIATECMPVELLLEANSSEELAVCLMNMEIGYELRLMDRYVKQGHPVAIPVFRIEMGDTLVDMYVVDHIGFRQPPVDAVTKKPGKGLDLEGVKHLKNDITH